MDEYQAATLAIRAAALWAAYGQIAATLVIGIGQIAVVWYGIRAMQRMGAARAREQDQRHEEVMTRADQRHKETMAALNELIRAGQAQTAALETVIERTAPRPAG